MLKSITLTSIDFKMNFDEFDFCMILHHLHLKPQICSFFLSFLLNSILFLDWITLNNKGKGS